MKTTPLLTLAERSDFRQTGRIDEVEALAAAYLATWPHAVHSFEYGRSVEGRPLRALLITKAGELSPTALRERNVPLLMIQAGIHPGESDGKDGGFIAVRELLESDSPLLERIAILFVPAFNTDGHERVGRWNRPNQNGPEETGWRTTAHNLNLNRDYTKADAPEMQAMLRLLHEWDPLLCADLHVTDGADFEPDVSLQVEPLNQGDPPMRESGLRLREELLEKLKAQGSQPLPFYPDLARTDDPSSGFLLTVYSPRFSTGYFPQRNRFTVLVETHSYKPYDHRVRVMRNTIIGLAELLAAHGTKWLQQARNADELSSRLAGSRCVLDYTSGWRETTKAGVLATQPDDSADARRIDFPGFAYTREPSSVSGDLFTVYHPHIPQVWHVPYRDRVQASVTVTAPQVGYLVPVAYAQELRAKLSLHGIRYETVPKALTDFAVQSFRATRVLFSGAPFEGRLRASIDGAWQSDRRTVLPGSLLVPLAQPLGRLVLALLEPQAPDSFAQWGFFNACFELKEQMEPYVAEKVARDMLDADPALKVEFERRLAEDAAFAADPAARLEFFLRRHSSWDQRYNLYPVFRM